MQKNNSSKRRITFNLVQKDAWRTLFKGNIFIIFSFFNCLFPLLFCIISAFVPEVGAQVVTGVGYTATFQLTFAQLGVSFATSLFFIFSKDKEEDENKSFWMSIRSTLIMGIGCALVYAISSFFYLHYSCNRPNTIATLEYGIDFMLGSLGFVILSSIEAYLFLLIFKKNKWHCIFFFLWKCFFTLLLCYLLGVVAGLSALGIGLSLTIVSLITTIGFFSYIVYKNKFSFIWRFRIFEKGKRKQYKIMQESISGISLSLFKGLALLFLNFFMSAKLGEFVPLSYQMSRVIWFNLMYLIPWVAIGFSDAIKYNDVYNLENKEGTNIRIWKAWYLVGVSVLITTIFVIIGRFLVEPLARLYTINDSYIWQIPELPPGISSKITLPPTTFPAISPNFDPNNIDDVKQYLVVLFQDPAWEAWLAENNIKLITILNNPLEYKQWLINYVSYTSYDVELIKALLLYRSSYDVQHPTNLLMLLFKKENFTSFSFLYISIYGIFCSIWSVCLPSTVNISKKQMSPLLICIVYFIIVFGIIGFGAIFSISPLAEQMGANNPFRYLDAWTFPVALTATLVAIYTTTKMIIISKKYYQKETL
ncbi:MAG: hypothetical protein ACRDAW_00210 [Metamycoplasmataceae bacterium]